MTAHHLWTAPHFAVALAAIFWLLFLLICFATAMLRGK